MQSALYNILLNEQIMVITHTLYNNQWLCISLYANSTENAVYCLTYSIKY